MLFKSILTGAVLAGLTGGVVYFGTGGELGEADLKKAVSDTTSTATKLAEQTTQSAKEKIDALTKAKMPEAKDIKEEKPKGPKEGSFMDRMTTEVEVIDTPQDEPDIDMSFEMKSEAAQKDTRRRLSEYLMKNRDRDDNKADFETDTKDSETIDVEIETEIEGSMKGDGNETTEEIIIWDGAAEGATSRFIVKNKKPTRPEWDETTFDETYQTVLSEAENIDIIDLRNRAYLSLIDYGIRQEQFDRSLDVIQKISQPELRDTARSNIAVGLARLGQSEAAFGVLEGIETEALSDVLRLQVIEAMTSPRLEN